MEKLIVADWVVSLWGCIVRKFVWWATCSGAASAVRGNVNCKDFPNPSVTDKVSYTIVQLHHFTISHNVDTLRGTSRLYMRDFKKNIELFLLQAICHSWPW